MPLRDLLWACPACHVIESLDAAGRCSRCGARFRRGRGARIRLDREGAASEELDAPAWLDRLPWPELDGEGTTLPANLRPPFRAPAHLRLAIRETSLRCGGEYLGRVEVLGPAAAGELSVDERTLSFTPPSGTPWTHPLTGMTALQPASSALQLKFRGEPVVSVSFATGSVRLWEQRLKFCTRVAWTAAGLGEIVEFQPRIRTR